MKHFALLLFASSFAFAEETQSWYDYGAKLGGMIGSVFDAPTRVVKDVKNHLEEHGAGKQAIKDMESLKDVFKEQGATIKKLAETGDNSTEAIKEFSASNKETNEILKDGVNTIKEDSTVKKVGTYIGIGYGVCAIIHYTYRGGSYIYNYIYPSQGALLQEAKDAKDLRLLKAEIALNECLGRNMRSPTLGEDGMPVNCIDPIDMYVQVAGMMEYQKVRQAFINR